jgi:hypothetical protein
VASVQAGRYHLVDFEMSDIHALFGHPIVVRVANDGDVENGLEVGQTFIAYLDEDCIRYVLLENGVPSSLLVVPEPQQE